MAEYRVNYQIDLDADSAMDAAKQVEEILKNPTSRPFFSVCCQERQECVNIDLETGEIT